ncbi:hypothetical protein SAMN00790413_04397 [Deinococcus hopiensis KR-140]|uniref:Uncharacterized protein n=1 Tax=Deinococcus hopiensis KR-140 TaxID=695939 RepID=A0A1W1UQU7_9DEIO|nr:hypothetical protein SAMN00790413_04397 [Deinococcus hopiensis KR-140]
MPPFQATKGEEGSVHHFFLKCIHPEAKLRGDVFAIEVHMPEVFFAASWTILALGGGL